MNKKNNIVIALNCVIPLLIGTIFYYFFSPNVIFVRNIDKILGNGIHFNFTLESNWLLRFIRFYVLDMLWAYALLFALFFIIGDNNTANIKKIFIMALIFSAIMEILQLTPHVEGTFDFLDMFFELGAEIIAVFIIKKLLRRNNE